MTDTAKKAAMSAKEKARAAKDALSGTLTTTLPTARILVQYPAFVGHDDVVKVQKLAGKDAAKVGLVLVQKLCRFGDEREQWSASDIEELLVVSDVTHLVDQVLADRDASGNASAP